MVESFFSSATYDGPKSGLEISGEPRFVLHGGE